MESYQFEELRTLLRIQTNQLQKIIELLNKEEEDDDGLNNLPEEEEYKAKIKSEKTKSSIKSIRE